MKRTVAAAVLILFLLQGCKPESPGPADLTGQELTVVTPFGQGDGYQDVYQQLLNAFQEETGCLVNDRSERSSEKWKLDVLNSFDSGEEPDVLFFFTGEAAADFIAREKVVDLETIRQHDPNYAMQINLSVLNTMKAGDGQNYCVPVTGYWEGLYINKDLFDAHELQVPATFDELLEVADAFNAAGIVPIAANLNTTPHYWFEYMLYNYTGPSGHNPDISDSALRAAMLNCFQSLGVLFERGAFPPNPETVTDDLCTELFVNKNAAMMLDGSWAAGSILNTPHVQVAYVPMVSGGVRKSTDIIGGFSMGYYITRKAWDNKRDAAVAFVKAMSGDEALTLFNANGSASPGPKQASAQTSEFVQSTESFISTATAFVPALQDGFDKVARDYLFSHVLEVLTGETAAETVIDSFFELQEPER